MDILHICPHAGTYLEKIWLLGLGGFFFFFFLFGATVLWQEEQQGDSTEAWPEEQYEKKGASNAPQET